MDGLLARMHLLALGLSPAAGVSIIPVLQRTLHYECVVLVKQFRPPMGGYCLEFPAGESLNTGSGGGGLGVALDSDPPPLSIRVVSAVRASRPPVPLSAAFFPASLGHCFSLCWQLISSSTTRGICPTDVQ